MVKNIENSSFLNLYVLKKTPTRIKNDIAHNDKWQIVRLVCRFKRPFNVNIDNISIYQFLFLWGSLLKHTNLENLNFLYF